MPAFLDPSTLSDREAVADAVLRFGEGLDDGDAELLESAFTEDAVVDMTTVGVGVMNGRAVVSKTLIANLGLMDTTHHISNVRSVIRGDTAEATCYALAQHFRPGEGLSAEQQTYMLRGNRYRIQLVRDSDWWRMRNLVITGIWLAGDPTIVVHH